MMLPGTIGYVVVNYDGIPVKHYPEDDEKMKAIQFSALIADLVKHTRNTLRMLGIIESSSL